VVGERKRSRRITVEGKIAEMVISPLPSSMTEPTRAQQQLGVGSRHPPGHDL